MDRYVVALTVIAAYDISDDGRRSRVAALLQAHGDRIQKSVFLLDVTADILDDVRARSSAILDLDEDSLYLFRQCGHCWDEVALIGQANKPQRVLYWATW